MRCRLQIFGHWSPLARRFTHVQKQESMPVLEEWLSKETRSENGEIMIPMRAYLEGKAITRGNEPGINHCWWEQSSRLHAHNLVLNWTSPRPCPPPRIHPGRWKLRPCLWALLLRWIHHPAAARATTASIPPRDHRRGKEPAVDHSSSSLLEPVPLLCSPVQMPAGQCRRSASRRCRSPGSSAIYVQQWQCKHTDTIRIGAEGS
jgi:hypothetical protein